LTNTLGISDVTVECWVYLPSTFEKGTFVDIGGTWPNNVGYGIGVGSGDFDHDGNELIFINDGIAWHATSTNIGTGWHHIAFTIDASYFTTIYLDGVNIHTFTQTSSTATDQYTYIGSSSDYHGSYIRNLSNGKIDEVRFWNTVRTESEIRQNMYQEIPGPAAETDLIAYYKLNETSDNTATDTQGYYNGSIWYGGGAAQWETASAFFGPKNALDFDGTNDYVSISDDDALDLTSNYTIEAWIYPEGFSQLGGIVSKYQTSASHGYVLRLTYDSPYIGISFDELSTSNGLLTENQWYHIAAVNNAGSRTLYINGVEQTLTGSVLTVSSNTDPVLIGCDFLTNGSTGRFFHGKIDEVRIWNDVRSQQEIAENMCKTLTGNEANLVAYYPLDNNYGTNAQDMTSDENEGTLTNMDGSTDWVSSAAFNTWLNTSSTSWSTGSNWSDGAEPASTDNVGIPNYSGGSQPTSSGSLACNNLVVGKDATLTFDYSGSHTIHGSAIVIGTSDIKSGNLLTVTGSLYILPFSALNVKAGGQLTVHTNLRIFAKGAVTLNSTASGTGSMIVNGTATGDVTVQRYMNNADWNNWQDGWHFLSSPVAAQTIGSGGFTTAPYDFYCWYELTNEWVNYKNTTVDPTWSTANALNNHIESNTTDFLVGKGYLAAYDEEGTKLFSGILNLSNVVIDGLNVTDAGANRSWHLLGNPYSSGLTWDETWTTTTIGGTIQIWNESGQSYSALTAIATGTIPVTNGFMIQATADGSAVTIPASKRVHGGSFYKKADFPIIRLKANNMDYPSFQESQLLFIPGSTTGYESAYDCDYLQGYAPQFYSEIDEMPMAVNAIPEVDKATAIPFTFIKNEGLNFSIELYESENLDLDIWLFDKKLNKEHNLTQNPVYHFTAFLNDDPNRFVIQFSPVGIQDQEIQSDAIQCWVIGSTLNIYNPKGLTGELKVYNMLGQVIKETTLDRAVNQQVTVNGPIGYYVVNISGTNLILNRRVFVQ